MRIIGGSARNLELETLPGMEVRPTAARSRKALFDSLGDFTGKRVLDLFSGSGALGLEAFSRGAAQAILVEVEKTHLRVIERNAARVTACHPAGAAALGSEVIPLACNALNPAGYRRYAPVDLIFADPPYAKSAEYFRQLTNEKLFRENFGGALLIWEIPDTPGAVGPFLLEGGNSLENAGIRRFGGTDFLIGVLKR